VLSCLLKKQIPLLNSASYHEDYGRVEIQPHTFLISKLKGGEWLASRSGRFNAEVTHIEISLYEDLTLT